MFVHVPFTIFSMMLHKRILNNYCAWFLGDYPIIPESFLPSDIINALMKIQCFLLVAKFEKQSLYHSKEMFFQEDNLYFS